MLLDFAPLPEDATRFDPIDFGTLYQSLERAVARYPNNDAYVVPAMPKRPYHPDGVTFTWKQTWDEVQKRIAWYREGGYGPGHRVAILFDQRPEFVFHHFALNALGCTVAPISPDYRLDEIAYLLEHSEAVVALAIESRLDDVRAAATSFSPSPPVLLFDALDEPPPAPPFPARNETPGATSEAGLIYTSGTTGRPKGCVLTNEYFHTWGSWFASRGGYLKLRYGEERLLNPLPLHHANGLSISLPTMLLTGGALVFPDRFHASTWWKDIVACGVTAVQFQGVIPNLLMKLPESTEEKQHQVRFALCAGVEPNQHAPFEKRFGFPLIEMWAMSETGRMTTAHREPRFVGTRAIGRSEPGMELRAVDEEGNDAPLGVPGELVLRSTEEHPRKGFFSGYLKNPEATEEAWRGGWFHTGDAVTKDGTGMFYFVERRKNIIRRSGENIAAAEVEAVIVEHNRVKQAAVIAVADELREEEVMACVVPADPSDTSEEFAKELVEWTASHLAYFKAPGYVLFVESLPTTSSQKVHKMRIFPQGTDPRTVPGVLDLRAMKKKS
jgi:crotonobetaine/carnitine-CoA ligase